MKRDKIDLDVCYKITFIYFCIGDDVTDPDSIIVSMQSQFDEVKPRAQNVIETCKTNIRGFDEAIQAVNDGKQSLLVPC